MATEKMRKAAIRNIGSLRSQASGIGDQGSGGQRAAPEIWSLPAEPSFLLHLVHFLENRIREMDSVGLQAFHAHGADAGGAEAAEDFAARAEAGALEFEDVLHLHLIVFDADNLRDAGHLAAAIAQARA